MSYQPIPNPPVVQQPAEPFAPGPARGGRRKGLIGLGALALLGGVGTGVAMIVASGSSYDDAVESLARAPIGCTTSLEFDSTGTYTIFVETEGRTGDVRGDCDASDDDYRYRGDELPDVEVVVVDDDDEELDLDDEEGVSYDAAGFVGESIQSVEIEEEGSYAITVTSEEDDFAIAIGQDPKSDADTLRTAGIAAAVAGLVLGIPLILLGLRRKGAPARGGLGTPPPPAPGGGASATTWTPQAPAPPHSSMPPTSMPPSPAPPSTAPPTMPTPPTQPAPGVQPPPAPPAPPGSTAGRDWPAPPSS